MPGPGFSQQEIYLRKIENEAYFLNYSDFEMLCFNVYFKLSTSSPVFITVMPKKTKKQFTL